MEAAVRVGRRWHRQVLASASREAAQSDHGDHWQRRRGASESEIGIVPTSTARVCQCNRELLITSALRSGQPCQCATLSLPPAASSTSSTPPGFSTEIQSNSISVRNFSTTMTFDNQLMAFKCQSVIFSFSRTFKCQSVIFSFRRTEIAY
jgi:hypothetical protein